jgi:hypothetical protein
MCVFYYCAFKTNNECINTRIFSYEVFIIQNYKICYKFEFQKTKEWPYTLWNKNIFFFYNL